MANQYQWSRAEERVRIGTPAAVSTWHSEIRPVSPLQACRRGVLEGSRDGRGMGRESTGASRSVLEKQTDQRRLGEPSPDPC